MRIEAVAICFLFSFLNPRHEQEVRDLILDQIPKVRVLISSDIVREFREFPRASTAVFAAYVSPVLQDYIETLLARLRQSSIKAPLYIFQSNGGIAQPDVVMRNPALTLLSGPAGAVVGAAQLCRAAGFSKFITMDIGGTSLDVYVVDRETFETTKNREIDFQPIALPMLDIQTAGAGGGSVVRVDGVGRVSVGPDSMAANPGPACYGRGGTEATLTDVNVVLGYLNPSTFANGEVPLIPTLAEKAITDHIGAPLGLTAVQAAKGVYQVAVSQMAEAIRKAALDRGHDPRHFALVAFGGGGPPHACAVAREAGMGTVIIPKHPGLFSALGIGLSNFYHDYAQSVVRVFSSVALSEVEALSARWKKMPPRISKPKGYHTIIAKPSAHSICAMLDNLPRSTSR